MSYSASTTATAAFTQTLSPSSFSHAHRTPLSISGASLGILIFFSNVLFLFAAPGNVIFKSVL